MISIVLYGRNDSYGYNLHKRAALSLNCMAHLLTSGTDEIIFVDYNTPDDFPTFPEAIQDTLTDRAKRLVRILRVRPHVHARYAHRTHLQALEPIARNVAVRRSNPLNRWILSTNTDMIFVPRRGRGSITEIASKARDGFYHLPRFEVPESLWETLDRQKPAEVIRTLMRWGRSFHLNEIVTLNDVVRFDGPGDFQMILRDDLCQIHGFDENMLVGWHVDSNIAKRLHLLRGTVSDFTDDLLGYHCDHTRQVTPAHRHGGTQNDWGKFYEDVRVPGLDQQATLWGLPDDPVEEIRLKRTGGLIGAFRKRDGQYATALQAAIKSPMRKPTTVAFTPETYNRIEYKASHVIPFLVDAVICYPRGSRLAWFGCKRDLLMGFANAWRAMGFLHPIKVECGSAWLGELPQHVTFATSSDMASCADVFVFDFGSAAQVVPDGAALPETKNARAPHVVRGLRMTTQAERRRLEEPDTLPRRLIVVNAKHSRFQELVSSRIGITMTPMSTRLQQGFVVRQFVVKQLETVKLSKFELGPAGTRLANRIDTLRGVPGYIIYGPWLDLDPGGYCFRLQFQIDDLATAAALRPEPLRLEIYSEPYLIRYYLLTEADLARGEIGVPFLITQELSDVVDMLLLEFRLKTDGRIMLSLVDAVLEPLPSSVTLALDEFDWLPLMSIGDAGTIADLTDGKAMPSAPVSSVRVHSKADGFVVFGPYCSILPGRYELEISLETPTPETLESSRSCGTVSIEVISNGRFYLSRRCIHNRDLRSGPQ